MGALVVTGNTEDHWQLPGSLGFTGDCWELREHWGGTWVYWDHWWSMGSLGFTGNAGGYWDHWVMEDTEGYWELREHWGGPWNYWDPWELLGCCRNYWELCGGRGPLYPTWGTL